MALHARARIVIAVVVFVLLAIFVPPFINLNRYHARIASSISSALGRPVTVGSVSPTLFPQPGFDLGNLTIGEDPAFGAEPMLHADEVEASLRLSSLWRGRLEIAKLSLNYPSLNLVRAADGRWNIEALLERASRIPTAPTGSPRPEARPRFPYIEASNGRINLKIGLEKKVYALSDADFALWLASENQIRTRLTARLVRTDSYLSDTGTVRFNGRFLRASDLRDTPLNATLSLNGAQLGQLTKFVDGRDRGWRGTVDADLVLTGTPAALKVTGKGSIQDFRRYDIGSMENVNFQARCDAQFSSTNEELKDVACQMPVGDGTVRLTGSLNGLENPASYDLSLLAEKIPAQAIVALARHVKKGIPDDLTAAGLIDASLSFRKPDAHTPPLWSGGGAATNLVLQSSELKPELTLKEVEFGIPQPLLAKPKSHKGNPAEPPTPAEPRLVITPFTIPLGGTAPAKVSAWFDANGYDVSVQGESELTRLLQVARVVGFRAPDLNADGAAAVNITATGNWAGFEAPRPTGTAQLRGLKVRMKGISSPLQIAAAAVNLGPDTTTVSNLNANFTGSQMKMSGWVRIPRLCDSIENCPIRFELHADQIDTDELNHLLNPRAAKRPWYAILGSTPEASILMKVQAAGQITAGRLAIKSVLANHVSAQAVLDAGKLSLTNLYADLWGGKQNGEWVADFTGDQPKYSGKGTLNSVAIAQLATLMHDNWAAGAISGTYNISASGFTLPDLLGSAKGQVGFDWRGGTLRHIVLNGSNAPLSFHDFSGSAEFDKRILSIAPESKMTTRGGIYQVSGTASLGRDMNLTLRNGSHAYNVTGTMEKPKVTPASQTEAQVLPKP